jgi:hypothetical protein
VAFTVNSHAPHTAQPSSKNAVCAHAYLLERVQSRNISADQLGLFADWLATQPEVPDGKWFRKFPGMIVCGEGELIKTFLQEGQIATGEELK